MSAQARPDTGMRLQQRKGCGAACIVRCAGGLPGEGHRRSLPAERCPGGYGDAVIGRVRLDAQARRTVKLVVTTYVLAAVVAAPLAVGWAVAHTSVEEQVGITPTTFTLSTGGHSEVRLGIAGTVYVPRSRGPLGLVATVNGPASPQAGATDLASYVSPRMLRLYTGLFHDPEPAIRGYVGLLQRELARQLLVTELVLTVLGGSLALLAGRSLVPLGTGPRTGRASLLVIALVVTSAAAGAAVVGSRAGSNLPDAGRYALPALDGTAAQGATTNSPLLRLVLGDAVPKVETMVDRQDTAATAFVTRAGADLRAQAEAVAAARTGEVAVLLQSDMHCNAAMTRLQRLVRGLVQERLGGDALAGLAITGDLTTNGTAAEGGCIEDEAAIAGDLPVAAIAGNHESQVSVNQMRAAGMKVLDGDRAELGPVSVLGAGDPSRTELFGASHLRGDRSEADVGHELYSATRDKRADLVLVHEGYAAQAFIGTDDMRAFLDGPGSPTAPYDDGVRDLPASAVLYGHWHRDVEPRVVWNSDGTWTLVMELNTSGGAVASPTLGHFSTPWTKPQQEASFPVLYLDRHTGLVTGYQRFTFATDGAAVVQPRVEVGDPGKLTGLNGSAAHRYPDARDATGG